MNFGHGFDELEFETRELVGGGVNPSAPLERNRVIIPRDHVGVNAAGTVRLLLKMDLPPGDAANLAHTFANEIEIATHLGMEDESHGWQTVRGNRCWKLGRVQAAVSVFVERDESMRELFHRNYVFEGTDFGGAKIALLGNCEMVHALCGAEFF